MDVDLKGKFAKGEETGKPVPVDALDDVLTALLAIVRAQRGPDEAVAKSIQSVKFEFRGSSFYPDLNSTITILDGRDPEKPTTHVLQHYQAFRTGQAVPAKEGLREGILNTVAKTIDFQRTKKVA
jgi:hypothetical protein